jgi:hypothetical protein
MPFVEKLREGYELVMGNRFKGGIAKGAMPPLHRYLGNPVLSFIGRTFYRSDIKDFHCGLRGFSKESILNLNLQTTGMEFASEMVVKSTLRKLKITEVPTTLSPDGRNRPPHLRSWHDGWRHLKFLLIHSPQWLFLYPGLLFFIVGVVTTAILSAGNVTIGSVHFEINTMLYTSMCIIIGVQLIGFSKFSSVYSSRIGLFPHPNKLIRKLSTLSLEKGIICGLILLVIGIVGSFYALRMWEHLSFTSFTDSLPIVQRIIILSVTSIVCGILLLFNSFYLYTFESK